MRSATRRFPRLIPSGKTVIHIEIEPTEIGRTTRTELALTGDARLALEDLATALGSGKSAAAKRASYLAEVPARMAEWRAGAADRLESKESPINVGRLMGELNKIMPKDAILVADGGCRAWSGLMFDTKAAGRHFLPDRGFASIGYGVPGGIGAQLGAGKTRRVVSMTGDGGFNMSLGELETARRLGANFVVCVFNNAASGYVKALQHAVYGKGNYQSSDLHELDYAAIGRDFGCHGIRVSDPRKCRPRCARASRTRRARRSSTASSPATPPRCSPPPTTAPSRCRRRSPGLTGTQAPSASPVAASAG